MAAAPSPSSARAAISAPADAEYAQATDATPNNTSEMSSTFLRPVPATQQPGRKQDSGKHQRVGVDEPLQVAGRGIQVSGERRQRKVEHGQVQPDHQHRQRKPDERPPFAGSRYVYALHHLSRAPV